MDQRICHNPDCRKIYNANKEDSDRDYCSFSCWEKVNCKPIPEVNFEKLEIA